MIPIEGEKQTQERERNTKVDSLLPQGWALSRIEDFKDKIEISRLNEQRFNDRLSATFLVISSLLLLVQLAYIAKYPTTHHKRERAARRISESITKTIKSSSRVLRQFLSLSLSSAASKESNTWRNVWTLAPSSSSSHWTSFLMRKVCFDLLLEIGHFDNFPWSNWTNYKGEGRGVLSRTRRLIAADYAPAKFVLNAAAASIWSNEHAKMIDLMKYENCMQYPSRLHENHTNHESNLLDWVEKKVWNFIKLCCCLWRPRTVCDLRQKNRKKVRQFSTLQRWSNNFQ